MQAVFARSQEEQASVKVRFETSSKEGLFPKRWRGASNADRPDRGAHETLLLEVVDGHCWSDHFASIFLKKDSSYY